MGVRMNNLFIRKDRYFLVLYAKSTEEIWMKFDTQMIYNQDQHIG